MKRRSIFAVLLLVLAAETAALFLFWAGDPDSRQDTVLINEVLQSVQADWDNVENHRPLAGIDYVVLDGSGKVLFRTQAGLSESVNEAVRHKDTMIDICSGGETVGKLVVYNDSEKAFRAQKREAAFVIIAVMCLQCGVCAGYFLYLYHAVIKPFRKLKNFAERVAGGNLDLPLEMDRRNIFGVFTESFDLMRSELKRARMAEAEANAAKKELVAKLSHDIKTPVASIKAASEVGAALTDNERIRENYTQIIRKADQINTLVMNLFTAALEELEQLPVMSDDMESRELYELIDSADYLHRASVPDIPECVLWADRLRLQQVFDNLFANTYKYAGTDIDITVYRDGGRLMICMEDYGGGVEEAEVALLKEKYKRGSNARNVEGAGLGLFISDYFMRQMKGTLIVANGENGLRVTVEIPLSGTL